MNESATVCRALEFTKVQSVVSTDCRPLGLISSTRTFIKKYNIHTFIRLMDGKKQKDREIQYVTVQQYSIHTCIVYNISNEQFTVLSPDTAQNDKT